MKILLYSCEICNFASHFQSRLPCDKPVLLVEKLEYHNTLHENSPFVSLEKFTECESLSYGETFNPCGNFAINWE